MYANPIDPSTYRLDMTTLRNRSEAPGHRHLQMQMPRYNYNYPSLTDTVQLAAVKEGIYHPKLPSLRRYDMDTISQCLPNEHSRTTTSLTPEDFRRNTSIFTTHAKSINNKDYQLTNRAMHRYYTQPDELRKSRMEFSEFLNRTPERYNIRLPQVRSDEDLKFTGYAERYLRPEKTSNWNYTLKPYPSIDVQGRKPIADDMYNAHRISHPTKSHMISCKPFY